MQPSFDRTTNTIERSLGTSKPMGMKSSDHFVKCRFDPFSRTPDAVKIPDGRGKNVITRDFKTVYNISVIDPDQLEIRVSPTYPYPVQFYQRTAPNTIVNGTILGVPNVTTPPPTTLNYIGTPVTTAMSSLFAGGVGATSAEAYNIVGARYITMGYRLYYTGAAADANGVIQIDNLSANKVEMKLNTLAVTSYAYSDAGASVNYSTAANTCGEIIVDRSPFGFSTSTSDQVVIRPENGLHGVLKMQKNTTDHPYCDWFGLGALVTQRENTSAAVSIYAPTTGLYSPAAAAGAFFWDDAFQETNIRIQGVGRYRLEIIACLEMDVALQSNLIDLARPSPVYDEPALRRDMMLNSVVVPSPFTLPPLDLSKLSISGRPRVRRSQRIANRKQPPAPPPTPNRSTGRTARKRRNRQRRAARRNAAKS